jgi:hypothetical protein
VCRPSRRADPCGGFKGEVVINKPELEHRMSENGTDEKHTDKIVELNTTEAEQVVGGKMVRAPVHPAGELNTTVGTDAFRIAPAEMK